jgi:hypothetical protein
MSRDGFRATRRAGASDRDPNLYARARRRAAAERDRALRSDDALVPPTDEDWVVADEDDPTVRVVGAPTLLADRLAGFVRSHGWDERLGGVAVLRAWSDIVGEDLARVCEPVRLAGGVLVVRVVDQTWATQLRYMLDRVRENVNVRLGRHEVRTVRLVVGALEGGPVAGPARDADGGDDDTHPSGRA